MKTKLTLVMAGLLAACQPSEKAMEESQVETPKVASSLEIWPELDFAVKQDEKVEAKVAEILSTMTLEQKVAQMIQPEIRDITVEDMRKYGFGSYLNGGGSFPQGNKQSTPQDWIALAESMYQASIDDSVDGSNIPTMWGTDAVHGHNNVIGATLFPHNIGLGAANNPALIEKVAEVTATEVMVTGIDWVFAPTVAVPQDDRWGRTYEGYSENPDIVKRYSEAIVKGLQGHADGDFLSDKRVISTVKHFVGDGGTVGGDDQGDNIVDEQTLFDIHAQGYVGGLSVGSQSVMASFNSWHGKKIHGSKYLLTDVLKDRMGFDGFVVGDWNGHGQIKGCTNENCAQAVNAGLDIFMVPTDAWKPLYENTIKQVNSGEISQARIDDAVTRILRVKVRAGLFDKPSPAERLYSGKTELIGQQSHRDVARQAVRESLVLLKNKGGILPLSPKMNILVTGDGANNIGKQAGGWSITWQGTGNKNEDFPGGTSIFDGIEESVQAAGGSAILSESGEYQEKPDVAIVVFGEDPYAEGHGDRPTVAYQRGDDSDLQLLKKLKADGIPVVSLFISGRPLWVNAEINASDAFAAIWLPGSEGIGVSDVIFKDGEGQVQHDFTGKLSFSWPNSPNDAVLNAHEENYKPLFPLGYGLTYQETDSLGDDLTETVAVANSASQDINFFTGQMQKPWLMWLLSGDEKVEPNSNTVSLTKLGYRTIDKDVQEDAFQLTTQGGELAGVSIISKSNFREDLHTSLDNKSALSFMIKVDRAPTKAVNLTTVCDAGEGLEKSCHASVDLTEQLTASVNGEWKNMTVDLTCFAQKGVAFADITSPFTLMTEGEMQVGIADIKYVSNKASQATISCQ